jgi:micrococcal nuclease
MKLPPPPYRYHAFVRRVIDGDTVVLDVDLGWNTWRRNEPVRLLGINAPELNCEEGRLAAEFLVGLVERYGEFGCVLLESHRDRKDKYGRMLGRLWGVHGDGELIDLNREMVEAGYAVLI